MLKILRTFLLLLLPLGAWAQLNEDFTDGDFTANPVWSGDAAEFTVNTSSQLQLNNSIAGASYLSTPNAMSTLDNSEWHIYVKQSFSPSGSNYGRVYLVSDQANLEGTLNGYFLQMGEAGANDAIELFKQSGTTNTSVCRGINGEIAGSSTVRIKVTRDNAGLWTLYVDNTGGTNYVQEATGTDATFNISSFFGVSTTYTASNATKFYYDDIYAGALIVDNTPPQLSSVSPVSANQLDLLFNEALDASSVSTVSNYNVTGAMGTPSVAALDGTNNALVHLTFTNSFTNGQTYVISVSGVKDIALNTMSTASLPFTYIVTQPAVSHDIVINEIYADNSSSSNSTDLLNQSEFVEIYNRSNKYIDLNGWKIVTGTTPHTIQPKIIGPGAYLILVTSGDTTFYQTYGQTAASAITLTNAGSFLSLTDNNNAVIDALTYSDAWYRDNAKKDGGYTLERINPQDTCSYQGNNWIASNSSTGGTPGVQNSVYSPVVDNAGPVSVSADINTISKITVCFNEGLDSAVAANLSNYVVSGGLTLTSADAIGPDNICVVFTFANNLDTGIVYTLTMNNLTDCKGNLTANNSIPFSIYKSVKPYEIVINEIMAAPNPAHGLPAWEYLELYNRSNFPFNIKDLTLTITSTNKTLPDYIIQPHSYLLITDQDAVSLFGISNVIGLSSVSLTDGGTTVSLKDSSGNIIHSITYSTDWFDGSYKKDGGWSLEMTDYNNPCGEATNWKPSVNATGGTPGVQNSVYASNPDNTAPELVRVSVIDNQNIQLYFTEQLDSISTYNIQRYTIDNGMGNPIAIDPVQPDFKIIKIKLPSAMQAGVKYTITVSSYVKDCAGNAISVENTAPFQLPVNAAAQDLVINEVLANPLTDGVDFVELYNRSSNVIDLKELRISSIDTITNILESVEAISSDGFLVFPGDYVVLTTKPQIVAKQYGTFNNINKKAFVQMEQLPSLNISDGRIIISNYSETCIDKFYYSEKMHFPLINDTKGVSLERISPERATQDNSNWHSASETVGFATPTLKNSQYFDSESGAEISLEPEVFSPDNDGYQDVLNISFKMDKPGYIATIRIYDGAGRLVRTLKTNELLGAEGVFSWDGINDNNEKARIGPYIVLFSAYHKDGDTKKVKKTCVLAAKL